MADMAAEPGAGAGAGQISTMTVDAACARRRNYGGDIAWSGTGKRRWNFYARGYRAKRVSSSGGTQTEMDRCIR
ncbi:hypothetical protein Sbs19_24930 [Sphingobium sp. BS19]|jgi:hypothetical protein|nr:hypothetical protein Sbs19_24930 [Sphingobium sp. BS19]